MLGNQGILGRKLLWATSPNSARQQASAPCRSSKLPLSPQRMVPKLLLPLQLECFSHLILTPVQKDDTQDKGAAAIHHENSRPIQSHRNSAGRGGLLSPGLMHRAMPNR